MPPKTLNGYPVIQSREVNPPTVTAHPVDLHAEAAARAEAAACRVAEFGIAEAPEPWPV